MKGIKLILLVLLGTLTAEAQKTINYNVILRSNIGMATMWDGNSFRIFGFAPGLSSQPTLPARILYANEGDTVILNARSVSQGEHHTIHLHGLDVDTRNDGDPATSFWLSHMQDTTYTFIAKNAGTYLYHCHVGDVVHVQMGMYGLIVVKAAGGLPTAWTGGPVYDKDYKWLMSEIDEAWHDNIPEHDTLNDQIVLPPYLPNYFLINGRSEQELAADDSIRITGAQNEFIYLRLANIGFFTNQVIFPAFLNANVLTSDGRPLPASIQTDTLEVMPGERYEVMLSPSAQFTDSILVNYLNMNTDSVWNTQQVPVMISGVKGIGESSAYKPVNIFPNPASQYLHIIPESELIISEIQLFNVFGQLVLQSETMASGIEQIDISSVSTGMYFVSLKAKDGKTWLDKLVIAR